MSDEPPRQDARPAIPWPPSRTGRTEAPGAWWLQCDLKPCGARSIVHHRDGAACISSALNVRGDDNHVTALLRVVANTVFPRSRGRCGAWTAFRAGSYGGATGRGVHSPGGG
ncbi:hypothetical protein MAPG_05090 [Magnaporthiopsis poae ATCC 64411]|uniref:Uncharacterized protein n=1 Tax=Magnaporthiopsis poae (strain ATCC 64411 / 73-15) TaxID=644358 RepID=A0A0C4DYG9_MAGP6|nr:hypothetical protein MAPG_05090 [Magnaporthiopsis poae ATCC 64411]